MSQGERQRSRRLHHTASQTPCIPSPQGRGLLAEMVQHAEQMRGLAVTGSHVDGIKPSARGNAPGTTVTAHVPSKPFTEEGSDTNERDPACGAAKT